MKLTAVSPLLLIEAFAELQERLSMRGSKSDTVARTTQNNREPYRSGSQPAEQCRAVGIPSIDAVSVAREFISGFDSEETRRAQRRGGIISAMSEMISDRSCRPCLVGDRAFAVHPAVYALVRNPFAADRPIKNTLLITALPHGTSDLMREPILESRNLIDAATATTAI